MMSIRKSKTTGIFKSTNLPLMYCRLVENNSLINSIVFSYFESLCRPENKSLIKDCNRRLKCKKKAFDQNLYKGIRKFLKNPTQDLLEILKNHLELFIRYKEVLLAYYSKKHPDRFGYYPQNLKNPSSQSFELLAKITKIRIELHKINMPNDFYQQKNIKCNFTINILQINTNQYCILYERPQEKIISPSPEINIKTPQISNKNFKDPEASPNHDKPKIVTKQQIPSEDLNGFKKCSQCNSFKPQSSFPNSDICHNCTITNSYATDSSPVSIPLNCLACYDVRSYQLYPTDFIPISCPDNHDFLCKACWSKSLESNGLFSISERKSRLCCPYNKEKIFGLSKLIFNLLKVECKNCNKKNCSFFGEYVCSFHCNVCITCQNKENKKVKNRLNCKLCNTQMIKKSGPWYSNTSLDSSDEDE